MHDLVVRGGTVVTPRGSRVADVLIRDGRIVMVSSRRQHARREIDASGLMVMPGMVDAHVHLMEPGQVDREDIATGTAAAARAGVTTVIEHTHASPVRTTKDLARKVDLVSRRARVDVALAAHAWPGEVEEIAPLWRAGIAYVKAFTCTTHGIPGHDAASLRKLFLALASVGAPALVHCEDESLTSTAEADLRAAGRDDGSVLSEWRSREAEQVAIATVSRLARDLDARVTIAHVSHPEAVEIAIGGKAPQGHITCETCPQYLTLLEAEVLAFGALRKFTPPARARNELDLVAMWRELSRRRIAYVASDHAPSTLPQKLSGTIWDVHFGLPGLDTTLSVLLNAAHEGTIRYELIPEIYARVPARTYGLWPRKGALRPGADADLAIIDPAAKWHVADVDVLSKAAWSPFSGRTLVGRTVVTILRGTVIAESGQVLAAPGAGRFVPGAGWGRDASFAQ